MGKLILNAFLAALVGFASGYTATGSWKGGLTTALTALLTNLAALYQQPPQHT